VRERESERERVRVSEREREREREKKIKASLLFSPPRASRAKVLNTLFLRMIINLLARWKNANKDFGSGLRSEAGP
jgi:hypothetical protein